MTHAIKLVTPFLQNFHSSASMSEIYICVYIYYIPWLQPSEKKRPILPVNHGDAVQSQLYAEGGGAEEGGAGVLGVSG